GIKSHCASSSSQPDFSLLLLWRACLGDGRQFLGIRCDPGPNCLMSFTDAEVTCALLTRTYLYSCKTYRSRCATSPGRTSTSCLPALGWSPVPSLVSARTMSRNCPGPRRTLYRPLGGTRTTR